MSSSLDEEAGLLFGVTADNLNCFITGHNHLDLTWSWIFLTPLSPSLLLPNLYAHWWTSQRNPAILSQSRSLPRRDRKKRRKEQLKSVRIWLNEARLVGRDVWAFANYTITFNHSPPSSSPTAATYSYLRLVCNYTSTALDAPSSLCIYS